MHDVSLPGWAVERGSYLNCFDTIDPARTALVIVDMQRVFMAPEEVFANPHAMDIVPAVNRLAGAMRDAGGTVIWTRQTVSAEPPLAMARWQYDPSDPVVASAMQAMMRGALPHALHPAMEARAGDLVLNKYRYSAFACPAGALEAALRERDVEMLVIVGTLTNVCCESTARDAYMRGYKVMVVADATAAVTDEEQHAALLNLRINFADVRSSDAVISMLEHRDNTQSS